MRYISLASLLVGALVLQAPVAHAIPMTFVANLNSANENNPANMSPATGVATVVLDPAAQTIQVNATFSGLTSLTQAAHIHCCAPLGTNAGVATTVPTFPAFNGFPAFPILPSNGVTAGNFVSAVYDLTQSLIYNTSPGGFVDLQGGVPQAEAALIAGIQNGQTYFNIHTQNFPGGEIRGQLFLAAAVPEPTSLALLGGALLSLAAIRRRRAL
jgi:hypothetical protein